MPRKKDKLADLVSVRSVTIDEYAAVRHMHRLSILALGKEYHSDLELAARVASTGETQYTDFLTQQNLYGAWVGRELVATSGWSPHDPVRKSASVSCIYVHPFFAREKLGTLMLKNAEERASDEGYEELMARANQNAACFFEQNGYAMLGHDSENIGRSILLPISILQKSAEQAKKSSGRKRAKATKTTDPSKITLEEHP